MPRNAIDITDQKFGRWTVLKRAENRGTVVQWLCRCSCGTERVVSSQNLREGRSLSCGCAASDNDRLLARLWAARKLIQDHSPRWLAEEFREGA